MQITIRGQNPKITSTELKFAAEWMGALIMSPQLLQNLDITVSLKEERGLWGSIEVTDSMSNLPRSFLIRLNPHLSRFGSLKTLAHELVHVKQYARGEMKDTRNFNVVRWNKQHINEDKEDYYFLPWEIEARGMEYGMYRRYLEHLQAEQIKF